MNLMKYAKKAVAITLTSAIAMTAAITASAEDAAYFKQGGTDYGFNDLASRSNGAGRQAFYNKLVEDSIAFWNNTADVPVDADMVAAANRQGIDIGTPYMFNFYNLEDFDLTFEEACAVFETVKNDNPLFYFFNYSERDWYVLPLGESILGLRVDESYAKGSVRQDLQRRLTTFINDVTRKASGYTTNYSKIQSVYKDICNNMTYAYVKDAAGEYVLDRYGNPIPSMEPWAHNVIGPVQEREGVCESYARTTQMMLNFLNVDNIYVQGYAAATKDPYKGHAWNYIKMDDGKFYGMDNTWGDQYGEEITEFIEESGALSVNPDYLIDYRDGYYYGYFANGIDFMNKHTPDDPASANDPDLGPFNFLYDLPTLEADDYYVLGDVNDDGKADIKDLVRISRLLLGDDVVVNRRVANTDGEGYFTVVVPDSSPAGYHLESTDVTMQDAIRLQKYLLGHNVEITRSYDAMPPSEQ